MMSYLFMEYPLCSTCSKARKWLAENGIDFTERNIRDEKPTAAELREWIEKSGLPLKKFFNTSGLIYKSMQLREKLPTMSDEEQISLLAANGMLVKRPLLIGEEIVLVGFQPEEWAKLK
jgi:arsenate reductase